MSAQDRLFGKKMDESTAKSAIQNLQATADECVKRFKDVFDIQLDFSEESLQRLDKLISEIDKPPTNLNLVVTELGSYLGEMLVRNLHGRWIVYETLFHSAIALDKEGETTFYPFHKVYKRFTKGSEESLWYFYWSAKQAAINLER